MAAKPELIDLHQEDFDFYDLEGNYWNGLTQYLLAQKYNTDETDNEYWAIADAETVEDAIERDVLFDVGSEKNQCLDWLHRGIREPLASMPLYVYAMYVYSAHVDPNTIDPEDFHVYRFADTHPAAGRRVQKLRVQESFKVPRIYGFTMPTAKSDPERNALFKSVLLRVFEARAVL